MKKVILFFIILGMVLFIACEADNPAQAVWKLTPEQIFLRKMVTIGNSITMGVQSAGIVEDFQHHSYPYLIAQQAGIEASFQQPIISEPGIGTTPGKTPLKLVNGQPVADDLTVNPLTLLANALLRRPYDNLGITGATLADVLRTSSTANSSNPANPFFDMVLRNPNFGGMTALDQAKLLNPSLILLWIGNNPILGAALAGSDDDQYFVTQADFQADFTELLTDLRTNTKAAVIMANIPNIVDIPYVNMMDIVFHPIPALGITDPVPVVFDATFQPVDFDPDTTATLYLPLLLSETSVAHLTLPSLSAYQLGLGIPDSAALVAMGLPAVQASALVAGMMAAGLNPTGTPLDSSFSLTTDETTKISDAVAGYNTTIGTLAGQFQVPLVDVNALFNEVKTNGKDGVSGKFVFFDPAGTGLSLDGVHPSNAGHALVANAFIQAINSALGLNIPAVNVADHLGQYISSSPDWKITMEAVTQVKDIYVGNIR